MIRAALVATATLCMLVCGAFTAHAAQQTTLIDATPAPDSIIVVEPSEIALSFSAPIREVQIRRFEDGRLLSDDAARIEGSLATVAAGADGEGRYLIDWKGTDGDGLPIGGAYGFTVDARGTASVAVAREISGAGGALGGLRVGMALLAAAGAVALFAAVSRWLPEVGRRGSVRVAGITAGVAAFGALATAATYGIPADASIGDLMSVSAGVEASRSVPGRIWLAAALVMGTVPFLIVAGGEHKRKWATLALLGAAVVAAGWMSAGLGWLARMPWLVMFAAMVVVAVIWVAVDAGRPVIVGIGVAVGFAIAALTFHDVQETGASGVAVRDDLLIELSLDPGAAGSNEMHLYGFATTGGAGVLEDAAIDAVYGELDIGPLPLRLVRAGPNHFLSYHADLPFSGVWTFDVGVRPVDGGEEHVSMEIGIK